MALLDPPAPTSDHSSATADPLTKHDYLFHAMVSALKSTKWETEDKTEDKFLYLMEVTVLLPKQFSGSTRSHISGAGGSKRKSEQSKDSGTRMSKRSKKATRSLRDQVDNLSDRVDVGLDSASTSSSLWQSEMAEDVEGESNEGY